MIRVVIAEDHPVVRGSISKLLDRSENTTVVGEAENGAKALEVVEQTRPDILLLDIEMPVMSGIEVAQHLECQKTAPKIIILSNYSDPEFVINLLDLGVFGYMVKEDAPQHLTDAVHCVHCEGQRWLSPAVQAYLH